MKSLVVCAVVAAIAWTTAGLVAGRKSATDAGPGTQALWAGGASGHAQAQSDDPGLAVVVGEPPQPLTLSVPALSACKLTYDAGRISVWDSVSKDNLLAPDTEFAGPSAGGDHDLDCDVDVDDYIALQTCFTGAGGGPVAGPCQAFDLDADEDVDLDDYGLFHASVSGGGICSTTLLTVYVEGLSVSTGLGDVTVTLLADPDGDEVFTVEATHPVTVVSIDVQPTSGGLGTPLTITMQPAIAPLAFDATTTAQWEGVYQPLVGPPTDPFQIAYDADQFRESSAGQASIIVGSGTISDAPSVESLSSTGTMPGTVSLMLEGHTLQRSYAFAPETDAAVWENVFYPEGPGQPTPPVLDGEPDELNAWLLSLLPDPVPTEQMLLQANAFHVAAVLRLEENPITASDAPETVLVDLVSRDSNGLEIDRVQDLPLNRVTGDDGDPDHIVYHNDLTTPIVLVDVALNKPSYPSVVLLTVSVDGEAAIVPATD